MSHKRSLFLSLLCMLAAPLAWAQNSNTFPWPGSGSIAVGTTTPTAGAKMDVDGAIRLVGEGYPAAAASGDLGAWLINEAGVGMALQAGGSLRFRTGAQTADRLVINAAGNVAIGPSSASNRLEIGSGALGSLLGTAIAVSNTSGNAVYGLGQSATARGRLVWIYNASEANSYMALGNPFGQALRLQDGGGFVGIGTQSPQQLLHVGTGAVEISSGTVSSQSYVDRVASLIFSRADIPTTWLNRITNSWSGTIGDSTMNFEVTNGPQTFTTPLTLTGAGRVGVGNPAPQFPLDVTGAMHVTGDAIIDGNLAAKYQDVAEWVGASEEMRPGTIVVIDSQSDNGVTRSTHAYDTGVAGVISEHPGITLGVPGSSKVKVATTGRVKVRVDATRSPIRRGDLLVSSDKPGVAMKSDPVIIGGVPMHRPGTLIGKALEPLPSGEGDILVLLSLQ